MRVEGVMPLGRFCFPRSHADVFDDRGTLEINATDRRLRRVFHRGEWITATAYDDQGYPVYCLSAAGQGRKQAS